MKLLRASALGVLLLLAAIIPSPLRAQSTDAPNTRTIDGVAVTEVTCAPDVYDCDNGEFIAYLEDDAPETAQCAPYNNHFVNPDTLKWVVGCAAVVAMLMALILYFFALAGLWMKVKFFWVEGTDDDGGQRASNVA